jgi:hypothetical protein
MRTFPLKGEHRIDHVLDHPRSGDLAVLGDVTDEQDGGAGTLREPDQGLRGGTYLGDGAGRGFDRIGPHGLDRVDHDETRRLGVPQRRQNVLDRGLGRELDGGICDAQPLGAQPDLGHGLLAGNIDRPLAAPGDGGGDLDQQGGFADAWIAADEQHRAFHESAAGDPVEFGDARCEPRRFLRGAGQRLEREGAALAGRAHRGGFGCAGALFRDGVPLAAGIAFALPAPGHGAAVLADEGKRAAGHGYPDRKQAFGPERETGSLFLP